MSTENSRRCYGLPGLLLLLLLIVSVDRTSTADESGKEAPKKYPTKRSSKRNDTASDLEGSETSYVIYNDLDLAARPFSSVVPPNLECSTYVSRPSATSVTSCGDYYRGQCQRSRYRSYDGTCNNIYNPTWGAANTRYGRLLPPNYGDGIQAPTKSVSGAELPLSRLVSFTLFPSVDVKDPQWTLAAMQWGQIITHDMAMIDGSTQAKAHSTQCCTPDGFLIVDRMVDPKCYPIVVPYNDPVYSKAGIQCMNFVRSTTDRDRGCIARFSPAGEQLTVVTHYLDLSIVYGSSDKTAANLRSGVAGRLRVDIRNNREWPPTPANKSALCDVQNENEVCYDTGDTRANQNPQLTVMQILLLREHNRVAGHLARLNPHWTDETIFQETRRIVIAEHQHISYYEWLPIFIGIRAAYKNGILYDTDDYVNDYDPHIDPSTLNEHSTGAFRYFHSLIAGYLNLVNEYRHALPHSLRLSDHFNRPEVIERNGNMDHLTRGMSYQPEMASDQYFDREITVYLFRNGNTLGSDLRATDIHRNRDHGLASYNDYRQYCGLRRAKDWSDFTDVISVQNVRKLASLYAHPDDVDLTVGGSLEEHEPGALAGPTFLCILVKQFYKTRVGDSFWYETGDHEVAFTKEQLNEIRKASISRIFCDNGDNIKLMQPKGFQLVSEQNPIVKCDDLPSVNLSLWKDYAPEIEKEQSLPYYFY